MRFLLALAAPLLVGCSIGPPAGPLVLAGADSRQLISADTKVGRVVAFGANVLTNDTESPMTDLSVSMGRERAGATITEVRVRETMGDYLAGADWPYEGYEAASRPLEGYELPPGQKAELLIIFTVKKEGLWAWPTTTVSYSMNGDDYRKSVTNGFAICTSTAACDLMEGKNIDEIIEIANKA